MIKFFRKIRKKIIQEDKMSKYFKYAIGEIILVVIGILIALQINNWNENRKTEKEKSVLLLSIHEDLKSDVIYLESFLDTIKIKQQKLQKQSDKISSLSFSLDSIENYVKHKIDPFITPFEGFNNNAYNSAQSSGRIDIINSNLKKKLFELSVLQKDVVNTYKTYSNVHLDEIRKLIRKYPIEKVPFTFIKAGKAKALIWSKIDKKDLIVNLNDWGTSKANLYRLLLSDFKIVLDKTKPILELIEKEIKND